MKRTATTVTCTVAAMLLATAMSGCSSSTKKAAAPEQAATASATVAASEAAADTAVHAATSQATVTTKSVGKLGTILVDGKGHTLYLFAKDTKDKSNCTGACAAAWPPLLTSGKAKATGEAKSDLLGTTKRSGGTQVTYNGHPVYGFVSDTKSGQANGQGLNQFGGLWWALDATGNKVTTKP
ncbi:Predicted lipoprotein with conserved Yx(FWY)xxD motif [Streptomyces sp. DvalAA-14]|uniref:COG4315 family predicted lipoprotein n=1 Tax=unclassified Streptomyces TaxID=2593676 RepID=UPI00081B4794|nr:MULTISPECIES: hypothetical protein [unclassified Streptomyces]MYS23553.1 hypothetical protein [Streptomyces sp. SID4948]SCE35252.1 Predicted lipoprotein with conserved Yx(FWY)xxD motif [Streptomyces sp. DvalAA-14]